MALIAQEHSERATALAIDDEITHLRDLPENDRAHAIKALAIRIRQQPQRYIIALAEHFVNVAEPPERDSLQEVITTLADALRKSPRDAADEWYLKLAELARYNRIEVALDDVRYATATSKLEALDRRRSDSDFTLTDLNSQKWTLKSLRGNIVLLNFWATWCGPCRAEIPDLDALYERFRSQGLVILAITDEDANKVKPFVSQQKVGFPVLLDPASKVWNLFGIRDVPRTLIYDRNGHLVAQTVGRPTMSEFAEMLALAGLR